MEDADTITEEEALRLENASLKRDLYQSQFEALKRLSDDNDQAGIVFGKSLAEKYKIDPERDSIDVKTRKITRAK